MPIQQLSSRLNVYSKRLEREFKTYLGVPPKFYSRIVRFTYALDYLHCQTSHIDWAELVYQLGYYDQAHLIKEFTEFLGHSPEKYHMMIRQMTETP